MYFFLRILLIALIGLNLSSCSPKKAILPRPPATDLQKTFETKCRKDYNLNVITRIVGRTFWIYVPTDKPLFDFAAESPTPPGPAEKNPPNMICFTSTVLLRTMTLILNMTLSLK